ncbi:hypothetical protein D3C78_783190 [compost metagenome]
MVGREFQAVPFGDVGCQINQQLALGGEGHGLALQRFARGFAAELHVFELVALEPPIEAQFAVKLGARLDHRLAGAEEGGHLQRDVHPFMHRAGAQLDAFGAEALAAAGIVVLHAGVIDGQAVDVELDRALAGAVGAGLCGGVGRRGAGAFGRGRGSGRQGLADVFPVAVAFFVAAQGQVQALDAHVAHLHFTAQQGQHAYRQAEHLQVGKRHFRVVQGGDAGFMQLKAQPREQAPADVAIERQLDVGLVACQLANLVFVVVGIEEVGQGEAQSHNDQQQPEKHQPQDFAERFHGRVLVVRFLNSAAEYSAAVITAG